MFNSIFLKNFSFILFCYQIKNPVAFATGFLFLPFFVMVLSGYSQF